MQSVSDGDLLDQFVRTGSDAAFGELVRRHIGLVHSVARRHTEDPHAAEEITQAVFILLARKAAALGRGTVLSGWLYHTARLTAGNFRRGEFRRVHREQEVYMQSMPDETPPDLAWLELAPLLDEAMGRLGMTDRDAVVLRYFENKNLAEVGAALGLKERAAQKRVLRALEKLRAFLVKRGVASTATLIAGAISANSIQAAPAELTGAVTAVAMTKGAAASGTILALVKGASKIMTWAKMKTAVTIGAGLLVAVGSAAIGSKLLWSAGDGISFEAEGSVTYTTTPRAGNWYTDTKHFIITRTGDLWKIRTITEKEERAGRGGPVPPSVDWYDEMGCDGTNLFTLEQQKFSPELPAKAHGLLAQGRVEQAVAPPCMERYLFYPVWLAYGAAPYFTHLKDDRAVSPRFARANRDFINEAVASTDLPARWTLQGPAFIKDVSWFSDGTYEATWPDGKITTEKYPAPYDKGFLQGRFENLSWTNWNGTLVPASFKLLFYRPAATSSTNADVDVAYTVTGTLEQIRQKGKFSPAPELLTTTSITDLRMNRQAPFNSYLSTNRWDSTAAIR